MYAGRRVKSVFVQSSGADLEQLGRLIVAGRVCPQIDRSYPLAQAAEAQRYSATKGARGKLVLLVDPVLADQNVEAFAGEPVSA